MTTVTDEEIRDSILDIRRKRKWKMIGVLLALLVAAVLGSGAVLLAYNDTPDAAESPTGNIP